MRLIDAINEALDRCNRAGGNFVLPDDYDCIPVLVVDQSTGKCVAIKCWRARIADHVSDGSSPELATYGICRAKATP